MPRYQDVYPESPLLESAGTARPGAAELLSLEYFEAAPGSMPEAIYPQHHVLLNLREAPHRVENWRDGVHRDFEFAPGDVIVTPAGVRSGWRWHSRSKVIVITLDPDHLKRFAESEAGVLLTAAQLTNRPQVHDPDLCAAAAGLRDALHSSGFGSAVVYESLARIFLVRLIQRYGEKLEDRPEYAPGFSSIEHNRVLSFLERNYSSEVTVKALAREAGLSTSHFSRLFKESLGQSPHQFVMKYRVERAAEALSRFPERPLAQVALDTGFSDQAHFSRTFKRFTGVTPSQYRRSRG